MASFFTLERDHVLLSVNLAERTLWVVLGRVYCIENRFVQMKWQATFNKNPQKCPLTPHFMVGTQYTHTVYKMIEVRLGNFVPVAQSEERWTTKPAPLRQLGFELLRRSLPLPSAWMTRGRWQRPQ